MDPSEAALRFWAGDRLQAAFMKKVEGVDPELLAALVSFVGEPRLAPRVLRLVPLELAGSFFERALGTEPPPSSGPLAGNPTLWARRHRHELARAALGAVLDAAEKKPERALALLHALYGGDDPDAEWGSRMRAEVARFGVERFQDLATRIFSLAEGASLPAQLADRLVWTAVHSARSPAALRSLVDEARKDSRSGSRRPRAAIAVARALGGVEPGLARPELLRLKVRVTHRVVLREVERSLAALGEGPEPDLPAGVSLAEDGTLVFAGRTKKGERKRQAAREVVSVHRALLEQAMLDERVFDAEAWRARFPGNSVLSNLARRVLWLADGKPAFFTGEGFEDLDGRATEPRELRVAHPLHVKDLERAQTEIVERSIVQPFRQLFRETYVPTDAEREATECERFVNEIVPFDTLYALTKQRGWSGLYAPRGSGPTDGTKLFAQGYRARLQVSEARHALGVCLGLLSFETKSGRRVEKHEIGNVPPVVFSETCRDLDLVVGVATLGEDQQGVVPASLAARRALIERVLPALGLGARAWTTARHVHVRGEFHEYRIHLASANVVALPSRRSIVFPELAEATPVPSLYLPVEADKDPRSAEVLRRVLVLAGDAFVTDPELAQQLAEA